MKISVNGEMIETKAETLAGLLDELGKADEKVATALNEGFVPVGQRAHTALANGDRIEIVAPRQGG